MTVFFDRCMDGVRAAALASFFSVSLAGSVSAVEQLKIELPVLDINVSLNLKGARTTAELIEANPDLQELDQAGDGSVSRLLAQFLTAPLGTAFCIASPLARKSFNVSEKAKYSAQDNAEYSPNE